MPALLRWLLIFPVSVAGVAVGMVAAVMLHEVATALCPKEMLISGACTASWFPYAEQAAFAAGAAVGATLAVALPSFVAPRHRGRVAWFAFAGGLAYALWFVMTVGTSILVPFVVSVASGALVSRAVNARFSREP